MSRHSSSSASLRHVESEWTLSMNFSTFDRRHEMEFIGLAQVPSFGMAGVTDRIRS